MLKGKTNMLQSKTNILKMKYFKSKTCAQM